MFDDPSNAPLVIDFLLLPDFSLIAFAAAIEPLRLANRLAGHKHYDWRISSLDGQPVVASSGVPVGVDCEFDTNKRVRVLILCSGVDIQRQIDDRLLGLLRRTSRQGAMIGSVCTGAFALARAGLLNNRRSTIHWENLGAFSEAFPEIETSADLFEIDRDRITCSGGTAALDMMLHLIGRQHGLKLAADISDQMIHDRIREPHSHQRMELRNRLGISHPKLLAVIADMEDNIEEPISQTDLASMAALSTRQLERLFRKYLKSTPTRHYLNLRLQRAQQLLSQTTMSILSVALACGFVSASHFSKCYRERYGRTPRNERSS